MEKEQLHGHPRFYEIVEELKELHSEKNHDYAAGGNPLGNFNRVSKFLEMYPGLKLSNPLVIALTYALKQLDAALWILSNGHNAKVEGTSQRLQDIAVYSIIGMIISEQKEVKADYDEICDAFYQASARSNKTVNL
jgi:hypothetical protein